MLVLLSQPLMSIQTCNSNMAALYASIFFTWIGGAVWVCAAEDADTAGAHPQCRADPDIAHGALLPIHRRVAVCQNLATDYNLWNLFKRTIRAESTSSGNSSTTWWDIKQKWSYDMYFPLRPMILWQYPLPLNSSLPNSLNHTSEASKSEAQTLITKGPQYSQNKCIPLRDPLWPNWLAVHMVVDLK